VTGLVVGSAALAAVWLLPGFVPRSIEALRRGPTAAPPLPPALELARALIVGTIAVAAVGGSLLAFGWFSATRLGVVLLALSVLGLPGFIAWARRAVTPAWRTLTLVALGVPALWSGAEGGLHPSHAFQWYYWDLGTQLTQTGGIPSWVLEFGQRVRWHPDYVFFSAGSEAYRWLSGSVGETTAIVAWRAPVALLGLAMTYAVLRLWTGRVAALCGTAAVSATTFYLVKFNAYKPESLGLVIGLACVCLLVHGLRRRDGALILLAFIGIGVDFGIHGIAAAVCSALGLGAVVAEWMQGRRERRAFSWRPLGVGAAAGGAVLLATGLSLQGRAVVATDAANPRIEGGSDPTWTFLERHDANFAAGNPPAIGGRIRDSVNVPWPSSVVRDWAWVPLLALLGAALAIAVRGPPPLRSGGIAFCVWLALLVAAGAFFALAFDSFIPQHTGITRIGGYLYLLWGMGAALLVEPLARRLRVRATRLAAAAALAFVVAWALPVGVHAFTTRLELSSAGDETLAAVRDMGEREPRGAVLSNASTRGIVEFVTELEQPIEGRQPVIEDPTFLDAANRVLAQTQGYFLTLGEPGVEGAGFLRGLDVGRLLVVSDPEMLGARDAFGDPAAAIAAARREPGLELEWERPGIAVFSVAGAPADLLRHGSVKRGGWPIWTALLLGGAAAWLFGRRAPR
jgi:hypothetical protein